MKGFCTQHGGYNNEDNRCLFCVYDILDNFTKNYRCCSAEIVYGDAGSYIKQIKEKRCRKHRA
jgi:hypothetical protein